MNEEALRVTRAWLGFAAKLEVALRRSYHFMAQIADLRAFLYDSGRILTPQNKIEEILAFEISCFASKTKLSHASLNLAEYVGSQNK